MNFLEDKLRESSRRERDFSPGPGQWLAVKEQLTLEEKRGVSKAGSVFRGLLLLLLGLALGWSAWLLYGQNTRTDFPPELRSFPLTIPERRAAAEAGAGDQPNWQKTKYDDPLTAPLIRALPVDAETMGTITSDTTAGRGNRKALHLTPSRSLPASAPAVLRPAERLDHAAMPTTTEPDRPSAVFAPPPLLENDAPDALSLPPIGLILPTQLTAIAHAPRKRPAPSHWHFSATWNVFPRKLPGQADYYQITPNNTTPIPIPITSTNEWIELYLADHDLYYAGTRFDQVRSFSFGRQFRSGLDLNLGIMYYNEPFDKSKSLQRIEKRPGYAYVTKMSTHHALYGNIGLRYVFRPYIGAELVGTFFDRTVTEEWFYFPDRNIEQLLERRSYGGSGFMYLMVPAPRAGFEYSLTPQWQIGLDVIMMFPGIKVQYNIPK